MRLMNMLGSIAFTIYGFMLPAYATAFMNICSAIINFIYLIKTIRSAN